ncbi:aminotransferase [Oceanibaculum pacificum]|uniref:Aminotransferase n=2 Tax=Oceanibaculum pacificum TaxID=580166 RepID=A0A154W3X1_9PROT|nr:aminotransferase [Oceanibaculum pacificum]
MQVKRGRGFLSTPGPTNVPDRVLNAMHRPAVDLNDPDFLELVNSCFDDLKKVFQTKNGEIFVYITNGHGAWEAALANVLSAGDKLLVPETGNFSGGWRDVATAFGASVQEIPNDWRRAMDPAKVAEALAADKAQEIKAVLLVHTDTAVGITADVQAVRKAIDSVGHPALLMVDTIASLGTVDFRMDEWGVDVAVSASQKGLMVPPGLGVVAAGPRAVEAHRTATAPRRYWDWGARLQSEGYRKFCGTAPEHHMFAMREALDMIFEEGLENIFRRHQMLADAVRDCVSVWTEAGALSFNAINPAERSNGVTTILTAEGVDAVLLRETARDVFQTALGGGLGKLQGKAFRIGHMGDLNEPMILGTLSAVETTLAYLDIPYQRGGIDAAIRSLAEARKKAAAVAAPVAGPISRVA